MIDLFIMLTYFGFWSVTLYHLGWGKRKFNPDYVAPPSRMFHNLWYCCLGAIQLAAWECVFMHLVGRDSSLPLPRPPPSHITSIPQADVRE